MKPEADARGQTSPFDAELAAFSDPATMRDILSGGRRSLPSGIDMRRHELHPTVVSDRLADARHFSATASALIFYSILGGVDD
jgi:hypothetical protein